MSKYESDKKSWLKSHSFTSAPNPCIAYTKEKAINHECVKSGFVEHLCDN